MCFIFNISASCSQVGCLLSRVGLEFRRRRVLATHDVFNLPQLFSIGALHSDGIVFSPLNSSIKRFAVHSSIEGRAGTFE
jgi:hypothetical protein